MNHRVLTAFGVSLGAHALLVAALLLPWPAARRPARSAHAGDGRPLSVRVEWASLTRPVVAPPKLTPVPPKEEYIPVNYTPSVGAAPVLHAVAEPPSAPPGGGTGGSGLLSAPATARRVVYLVDRSVSMGLYGGLERACVEVRASLRALRPDARFQVIAYNRGARHLLPGGLLPAEPETVDRMIRQLDDLRAEGETDHLAALQAALVLRPEVVFLVTDADDLKDKDADAARRMNPHRATLNAIELARGPGEDGPLARLCRSTGGTYRRVVGGP